MNILMYILIHIEVYINVQSKVHIEVYINIQSKVRIEVQIYRKMDWHLQNIFLETNALARFTTTLTMNLLSNQMHRSFRFQFANTNTNGKGKSFLKDTLYTITCNLLTTKQARHRAVASNSTPRHWSIT